MIHKLQFLRSAFWVVGVNLLCLLVLVFAVVLWRRHEPMTAARLRASLAKKKLAPAAQLPFAGSIGMTLCVLSDLELPVSDEQLVQGLLVRWAQEGKLRLIETDKKKLESFGADRQATIVFAEDAQRSADGAENLLFGLLHDWAGESGAVQESVLYSLARAQHDTAANRLEQFLTEGKHALRASGAVYPEKKHRRFGFLDERRTIYTPRGEREAAALLGYRERLRTVETWTVEEIPHAIVFGLRHEPEGEDVRLAERLAKAFVGGARAGTQAASRNKTAKQTV